jgi:hypothetical protein
LRQFFTDLLRQAGVALEWSRISETPGSRERLMFARDQAVVRDSAHLAEIMAQASSPMTPDRELGRLLGTPQATNQPARDGSYVGPVKAVSATEVWQDVGGREIRHELAKFMSGSGGWKTLQAGTAVRIEYKEGLWKVRDPNQQVRSRARR